MGHQGKEITEINCCCSIDFFYWLYRPIVGFNTLAAIPTRLGRCSNGVQWEPPTRSGRPISLAVVQFSATKRFQLQSSAKKINYYCKEDSKLNADCLFGVIHLFICPRLTSHYRHFMTTRSGPHFCSIRKECTLKN